MATLQQFEKTLVRFIMPVPTFIALEAVRDAFQELCKKGYVWLTENAFDVDSGTMEYPLTVIAHSRLNSIVAAAFNGKPLVQGQDFEMMPNNSVRLLKKMTGHLRLILSLYPTENVTDIDDEIYERFRTAICAGAAADLGKNEKTEWALSKGQIADYKDEFHTGIAEAKDWALNKASRLYEVKTRHNFF